MSEQTPGSWIAIQERHFWVVEDSKGQRLASLLESECVFTDGVEHDDAAANAKLMAAAPILLKALVEAREMLEKNLPTLERNVGFCPNIVSATAQAVKNAEEAITQAMGSL